MTITVHVDGWPHVILFSGTVSIERENDGLTVAVRSASDDFRLWGMVINAKEIERQRAEMRRLRQEEEEFRSLFSEWSGFTEYSGYGGIIRAGYD